MQNDGHKMPAGSKMTAFFRNDLVRLGAILFLITAIAGCCLGFVYESTKDVIADKKEAVNPEGLREGFAGCRRADQAGGSARPEAVLEVYRAENGGVAMKVMGTGYGGDLELAVGIECRWQRDRGIDHQPRGDAGAGGKSGGS